MSDDFTARAARLEALAGLLFGWRRGEFRRATPGELAGLLRALRDAGGEDAGVDGAELARLREIFPDD